MAWSPCLQYWEGGCCGCWTSVSYSAGACVVWVGAVVFQLMNNFICGLLKRPAVIMCFIVVLNCTQYFIVDALLSLVVTCVFYSV